MYSIFRIHYAPVTFAGAYCIRFFAYNRSGCLRRSIMYSIFSIQWVRLPSPEHIVFDFSHTMGPVAFAGAYCIRFFAYNRSGCLRRSTLYSIFRIQSARLPSPEHIVFDFSHTIVPFDFAGAHCIRFFAYNRSGCLRRSLLYAIFSIQSVRLPSQEHIVFDFSHIMGPFTSAGAHCIRFFEYNGSGYLRRSTLYSIFSIQSACLPSPEHIVFDFSHTLCSFPPAGAQCVQFLALSDCVEHAADDEFIHKLCVGAFIDTT